MEFLIVIALVLVVCDADMYLHNMRGSNNRLNEANRDRDNANRLFDSQNNNRGGYNVGRMYFYEGEIIPQEWTNQHGCGIDNNDCQIILQMMCDPRIRDGTTTTTIPAQPNECANFDCNNDVRFGMHEDYDYYTNCRYRYRNRGLFNADRNLQGNTAIFTRQNENGNRRGYECQEERDNYPYWHPTPWIDIAIYTNDASRCEQYRNESENILGRNYCWIPDSWYHFMVSRGGNGNNGFIPNTEAGCLALNQPTSSLSQYLKAQLVSEEANITSTVQAEYSECLATVMTAAQSCSNNANPLPCVTTIINNANVSISPSALAAQCPLCSPTGPFPAVHPYSACPECIAANCTSSFVAVNSSLLIFNATSGQSVLYNNGCPAGYVLDPNAPNYCNTPACIITAPYSQIENVDTCRANYLSGRNLILYDTTVNACVMRTTISADCRNMNVEKAAWVTADPHNATFPWLGKPFCAASAYSRVNHLGNGLNGFTNGHNVSMLPVNQDNCVFRVRYNITTSDYNNLDPQNSSQVNSIFNSNGENSARILIDQYHNIPTSDSTRPWRNARGYYFKQNPQVQIFDFNVYVNYCQANQYVVPGDHTRCYTSSSRTTTTAAQAVYCPYNKPQLLVNSTTGIPYFPLGCVRSQTDTTTVSPATTDNDFVLQLAINTNQFGRTFQDRSHVFDVRPRDEFLSQDCNNLYALNVRGKRGNIVQVYPGVEYDFTPTRLHVAEGDCVHFQWTGSNTNPDNNDGQGEEGTDRSNIAITKYVRGHGGQGVLGYDGKGLYNNTWTTAGLEPGWETWMYNLAPTMADVQCPQGHPQPHPYNWTICAGAAYNFTNGARLCYWVARTYDSTSQTYSPCTDSTFVVDAVNSAYCVPSACAALGHISRPANPTSWGPGGIYTGSEWGTLDSLKHGGFGLNFPEHLDNVTAQGFLGLTREQLTNLAILNNLQLGGNMKQLDDAGTYFDLYPQKVQGTGTYFYMCTRNNNFSNRGQKALILVADTPETSAPVGNNGGIVGISTSSSYVNVSLVQTINAFDYAVQVPAGTFIDGQMVQVAVLPAGSLQSSSDILFLGPVGISAQYSFSGSQLVSTTPNRKRGDGKRAQDPAAQIWVMMNIINATAAAFTLQGDSLAAFVQTNPGITALVTIHDTTHTYYSQTLPFNQLKQLQDTWSRSAIGGDNSANIALLEQGKLWVTITIGGETFTTNVLPDPGTGAPLTVKMPVSISLTNGRVFFWADSNSTRDCLANPTVGCNYLRSPVNNAQFANGFATFQVGASVTTPAGGFYQVDPGNDEALIVGVTAACVCITLVVVILAIHFRKRPAQWAAFKNWGPSKYKSMKRSFASRV